MKTVASEADVPALFVPMYDSVHGRFRPGVQIVRRSSDERTKLGSWAIKSKVASWTRDSCSVLRRKGRKDTRGTWTGPHHLSV